MVRPKAKELTERSIRTLEQFSESSDRPRHTRDLLARLHTQPAHVIGVPGGEHVLDSCVAGPIIGELPNRLQHCEPGAIAQESLGAEQRLLVRWERAAAASVSGISIREAASDTENGLANVESSWR